MRRITTFLTAILALFFLTSGVAANAEGLPPYKDRPLRIVSQNLYVGGDIFLPVKVPPEDFQEAAATVVEQILATNYPERAGRLAKQIRREWPHLVGLQEVYRVRICFDETQFDCILDQDYLEILLENLNQRWDTYRVVATVTNTELLNIPALLPDETPIFVTIIDRDVTLAHRFVYTENPVGANYSLSLPIENPVFPGGVLEVLRGYTMVDALVWGNWYRFANTHIETKGEASDAEPFFRAIQMAQTIELLSLLQFDQNTQIVVGDFNSDPFDGPFVPCFLPDGMGGFFLGDCMTPYTVMTGVNPLNIGYTDVWLERKGPFDLGNTCCQETLLGNEYSQLYERIDQIWARRSPELTSDQFLRFVSARLIGDEQRDKTRSGLWPSDHAGISARMLIRAPR